MTTKPGHSSQPGQTGQAGQRVPTGRSPGRRVLAIRRSAPDGAPLVALEVLAREAGLHPELVRRLIALGALEAPGGTTRAPLFGPDAAARLARIARLRRDLGLNYAGALLACDLLVRIEALEDRLAHAESRSRR